MPLDDPPILPFVVEQHADEAAFLWTLRARAVGAAHYGLGELAELDERLEAHLDGLRLAGEAGWSFAESVSPRQGAGGMFVLASQALDLGDEARIRAVMEAGAGGPEQANGLASALGWLTFERAEKTIQALLKAASPTLRRVGLAASAIHRRDPGRPLADALGDRDLRLRERALRAVGELGLVSLHGPVSANLSSDDPACRFAANWSYSLLFNEPGAAANLKATAEAKGTYRVEALCLALRRMESTAAKVWLKSLIRNAGEPRLAIIGAGVLGDPEFVPWLIEQMKLPTLARVAGEAFVSITGSDLTYGPLNGERPEGFESGPNDDPADENVEMDPDDDLPWPDPIAISAWWRDRQGGFAKGTRYLLGKPITPESLQEIIKAGRQRQRAAAALELAIRRRGQPLFEVRAPGFRQRKALGL